MPAGRVCEGFPVVKAGTIYGAPNGSQPAKAMGTYFMSGKSFTPHPPPLVIDNDIFPHWKKDLSFSGC